MFPTSTGLSGRILPSAPQACDVDERFICVASPSLSGHEVRRRVVELRPVSIIPLHTEFYVEASMSSSRSRSMEVVEELDYLRKTHWFSEHE